MTKPKSKMTRQEIGTFAMLILMYIFLMADSRIMAAIIPELSDEYGASKQVLGMIGTAFVLVGAFVGIFAGFLTDRFSRKKLLIATVLVGEIPCLLTGIEVFTQSIEAFVILRVLTGLGMGGITPITYSLVSDYFSEGNRAKAAAGITVAWAIGILMGPSLAGYLTNSLGWRIGFILAAAPNFPLAILFAIFAREPARGGKDAALKTAIESGNTYKKRVRLGDVKKIFTNKTNLVIFLQGAFGTIPWGITGFWAISFFEETRGFSKEAATSIQNLVGLGAILGTVAFGIIGDKLYRGRPRNVPLMCGIGTLVGVIPFYMVFNMSAEEYGIATYLAVAFFGGLFAACAGANVKAILMNVNSPENRGSVFGVLSITEAIGPGFGPFLGSVIFMWWGMSGGMNFSILCWIPCGLVFLLAAAFIEADRKNLESYLTIQANRMEKKIIAGDDS
ncbi:MAG: MFS transporter [Deltaproteobacteria bacterium]|nr:MFS transporter [Deltaproteobacteria bacterium]